MFPHARQVFQIDTTVYELDGTLRWKETRYGITSLSRSRARARHLLELSRGHWSIENKVHWVRDVTFDEDRSQVRRRAAPRVMASLRNTAMNLLRLAGAKNIARATRHCASHAAIAARLIGVAAA